MTIEAVGIADGDDGNARRTLGNPSAVVADGVACGYVFDLGNAGLEAADRLEKPLHLGLGGNAVETYAETHHVHLGIGKADYAGGVEDMAEDRTRVGRRQGCTQSGAPLCETVDLQASEVVARWVFTTCQMREDGTYP